MYAFKLLHNIKLTEYGLHNAFQGQEPLLSKNTQALFFLRHHVILLRQVYFGQFVYIRLLHSVVLIVFLYTQKVMHQRFSQNIFVLPYRIQDLYASVVSPDIAMPFMQLTHNAVSNNFIKTQSGNNIFSLLSNYVNPVILCQFYSNIAFHGYFIVSINSGHFFYQVYLPIYVPPEAGNFYNQIVFRLLLRLYSE